MAKLYRAEGIIDKAMGASCGDSDRYICCAHWNRSGLALAGLAEQKVIRAINQLTIHSAWSTPYESARSSLGVCWGGWTTWGTA